ncbi:DUF1684 domain-containing protein [Microbacterium fluvii]|uniref:DUF1684 domain-containing protein n=1 Tax=Microbacterium fluvii TaxID=415215 RepID=A0ABW2H9E8_9MICO|nr:DUF1684 domain-containing protein [Microbacterium fluvii]MCU4671276.1 DUF1684 domain-containing protein [Microbacterium fluvii]
MNDEQRDALWRASRDDTALSPYGLASLALTQWLDETPRPLEGAPGLWHTDGGAATGELPTGRVVLAPGETLTVGDLRLRGFARDGAVAVRVLDPEAAARRGITSIRRFDYDPALHVEGFFEPAARDADTLSVDGHASATTYDGVVRFALDGAELQLTVEEDGDELFAAFADATSGSESYRFRFLRLPHPSADGRVTVDLNRAHLPPCAFSDHYVCVLPPAGNRWSVPVRAGERDVA